MATKQKPLIPNFELSDHLDDCCDHIDAAFFSGDSMESPAALSSIKRYVDRWQRKIAYIEKNMVRSEWEA
jgi:hypothetical protein